MLYQNITLVANAGGVAGIRIRQPIQAGYYGWAGAGPFHHAQRRTYRFPNSIGGYAYSVNNYSLAAAKVILSHMVGTRWWTLEWEACG